MPLARALLVLVALMLCGCPDRGGAGDATAERGDAPLDGDTPDVAMEDASDDLREEAMDAGEDAGMDTAPDADVAVRDVRDADVPETECIPGNDLACRCFHGAMGVKSCHRNGRNGACLCVRDAGDGGVRALPPRLVAPLSASRVSSQRPTLRWVLPAGVETARVELCRDRACARMAAQAEVRGTSWRSAAALTPGVMFWRVRGLAGDGGVAWTSATWSFSVKHRDAPVDTSTHPLHDFNGDGYDDVVTKPSGLSMDRPILVYLGGSEGLRQMPNATLQSPEYGPGPVDHSFGTDVDVGDFNGDGLADLAISEPYYRPPAPVRTFEFGHVHVYFGGPDGISASRTQRLAVLSEEDRIINRFGSLTVTIDFNGDGYDDLFTGRSTNSSDQPRLYLFRGSATGLETSPITIAYSLQSLDGNSSIGVGDVDGDGYGDIAFGMPNPGEDRVPSLVVLHGNPENDILQRVEHMERRDEWFPPLFFASSLAGGDYNGDGLADITCGAMGAIHVAYGTSEGIELGERLLTPPVGTVVGGFGENLLIQGDIDGDGRTDLVAGAACASGVPSPMFPCWYGLIYLFRSSADGVRRTWERHLFPYYLGDDSGFGPPASPGDLNGDGHDDLVVGSVGSVPPDSGVFPPDDVIRGALHGYFGGRWDWERPSFTVRSPGLGIQIGRRLY